MAALLFGKCKLGVAVMAISIAGCTAPSAATHNTMPTLQHVIAPEPIPLIRYGRYRFTELTPEFAQRDLMQQVIDVSITTTVNATVGDALRHVLLRTGYRLCESADSTALYELPLPAAHLNLGPLVLRDALTTLAGPAWDLVVDEINRQVCFTERPPTHSATSVVNSEGRP